LSDFDWPDCRNVINSLETAAVIAEATARVSSDCNQRVSSAAGKKLTAEVDWEHFVHHKLFTGLKGFGAGSYVKYIREVGGMPEQLLLTPGERTNFSDMGFTALMDEDSACKGEVGKRFDKIIIRPEIDSNKYCFLKVAKSTKLFPWYYVVGEDNAKPRALIIDCNLDDRGRFFFFFDALTGIPRMNFECLQLNLCVYVKSMHADVCCMIWKFYFLLVWFLYGSCMCLKIIGWCIFYLYMYTCRYA